MGIYVKDGATAVAQASVDANNEGFDCVYNFDLVVPDLPCYTLYVAGNPVAGYPRSYLQASGYEVGYIDSGSVWGGAPYADFPRCEL
ncbi:MAG: hypothetical protein ABJA81_02785 [Nocardioidaceae bacterium]